MHNDGKMRGLEPGIVQRAHASPHEVASPLFGSILGEATTSVE